MNWIIAVLIIIILLVIFARSTAREANRISTEVDFRLESLKANAQVVNHLLQDNDGEAEKAERKAARYKARAEEVASRQTPAWKAVTRMTRKTGR